MKKKILFIAVLALVVNTMYAQSWRNQSSKNVSSKNKKAKRGFFELGATAPLVQPSGGGGLQSYIGFTMSGGKYLGKNNYAGLEVSFCGIMNGKQVGTFDYTITSNGTSTYHTDGKINENYSVYPILLFWNYAPDLSPRLTFNVGPVVGMSFFHFSYKFNPSVDNAPKMPTDTKTAFNYGGEIGLMYRVTNNEMPAKINVGLRYKLLENSDANIGNVQLGGLMHQISLVLNFTF
jgi:hypothetical protein